jgi:hypothetical protein
VLQSVPAARDQRHSGPHVCEPDRDPPADSPAGSGYDRDLSLNAIHARFISRSNFSWFKNPE